MKGSTEFEDDYADDFNASALYDEEGKSDIRGRKESALNANAYALPGDEDEEDYEDGFEEDAADDEDVQAFKRTA
jgi:hypothetical protein